MKILARDFVLPESINYDIFAVPIKLNSPRTQSLTVVVCVGGGGGGGAGGGGGVGGGGGNVCIISISETI